MRIKKKYFYSIFIVFPVIIALLFTGFSIGSYYSNKKIVTIKRDTMLSGLVDKPAVETPTPSYTLPFPTKIPASPTPVPATPTPFEYKISFIDTPIEITEGAQATFTWTVSGPSKTIHKSTIYYGTVNNSGTLSKEISPMDSKYTESVKDFLQGDFVIPIRFVGNTVISKAGKYYARAYALIDDKNYWSEEREIIVKSIPVPVNEIKIINFPQTVKLNDNSAFTWEITGPQATTGFTAIVGAKESKSGHFEDNLDLSKTPYKVLVKDFTNGVYNIPLRYVGNAVLPEYGTYYIRALVIINGKNIWTEEYTLNVQ